MGRTGKRIDAGATPGDAGRMDHLFTADLFEWRGPAPFHWLGLPEDLCAVIRAEASRTTYGWGVIPVRARIGTTEWETSLMPRDGGYLLPVKDAVRKPQRLGDGDTVTVGLSVAPRGGRAVTEPGPRRARP